MNTLARGGPVGGGFGCSAGRGGSAETADDRARLQCAAPKGAGPDE